MNSSLATAERLLGALERFVAQESMLLRAGHYREMAAIQRRASPVIAHLCRLGAEIEARLGCRLGDTALGGRIAALMARRRENLTGLAARREFLASERVRLAAKANRIKRLTPYVRPPRARLSGVA